MPRVSLLRSLLLAPLALAIAGCAPQADFSVDVTAGDAPLIVEFTDESQVLLLGFLDIGSIIPISSREWAFGDLTGSIETDPTHTYKSAGLYSVSLTVSTLIGSQTTSKPQLIRVDFDAPTAKFTAAGTAGDVRKYTFTDSSTAGGAAIGTRQWAFGDGLVSTETSPVHTYAAPGTYTATLTVCSTAGCDTASQTITVPAFTAPTAQIRVISSTTTARGYDFTDASTAGNLPITSRQWTFGDGGTSTVANPSHAYSADGVYTVTLESCAGAACDDTAISLTVGTRPSANYTIARVGNESSLTFDFRDGSAAGSSPLNSRQWTFSDGEVSTSDTVRHTFAAAGDYTVSLEVCGGSLCSTLTRTLRIQPGSAEIIETP